jgi:glycosyltransferase involved in cell wall biosynthesis
LIGGVRDEDRPNFDRRLAANPALQAAVRSLDWVEQAELPAYYRLLDCFWHPALADGLPNALLEAMACGLPVAASAVGGAPDVLTGSPQEAGLIPALDPHALVRRTNALLALSSSERQELGADSRRWIQRQFSPEREQQAYLDVYRELAGVPL